MKEFLKSLVISVISGIVVGSGVALVTGNYNHRSPQEVQYGDRYIRNWTNHISILKAKTMQITQFLIGDRLLNIWT